MMQRSSDCKPGFPAIEVTPDGRPRGASWVPPLDITFALLCFDMELERVGDASARDVQVSLEVAGQKWLLGILSMFDWRPQDEGTVRAFLKLPQPVTVRSSKGEKILLELTNHAKEPGPAFTVRPDVVCTPAKGRA